MTLPGELPGLVEAEVDPRALEARRVGGNQLADERE
jgi:hypothetical protein